MKLTKKILSYVFPVLTLIMAARFQFLWFRMRDAALEPDEWIFNMYVYRIFPFVFGLFIALSLGFSINHRNRIFLGIMSVLSFAIFIYYRLTTGYPVSELAILFTFFGVIALFPNRKENKDPVQNQEEKPDEKILLDGGNQGGLEDK